MSEEMYTVGGTVQAGSGIYLARRADGELLDLCRQGAFAYILSPRQIGKSSLMVRTAEALASEGIRSVIVDLTQLGIQLTSEAWYLGLLAIIEDQLMLQTDVVSWWAERASLGFTQRLTLFFEQVLLNEISERIVIFIDEIDTTLSLNFTDDFYAAIRYLYNARAIHSTFQRLSFVLIGVATPGDLIRDPQRTPFNIGQRVDLTDWTFEEALPLAAGFGLDEATGRKVLGWAMDWTHGHPYLTQRLCRTLTERDPTPETKAGVDGVVQATFLGEQSQQDNNLQFVRDMLTKRAPDQRRTLEEYRAIWSGRKVPDDEQSAIKAHLKLSGVVRRAGNLLQVRNQVYAEVFNKRWFTPYLPSDIRKQLLRAAGALIVLFFVVSPFLAAYAWTQKNKAEVASIAAERDKQIAIASQQTAEAATNQAAELRQLAESQAIALRASNIADPELNLLINVEALKRNQNDQTIAAVRAALKAFPENTRLEQEHGVVWTIAWSPDGKKVVSGHTDGTVVLWGVELGRHLALPQGHTDRVVDAAFSPDGTIFVTASWDGTARLWSAETGEQRALFRHSGPVNTAEFDPAGTALLTASADQTAQVWNVISQTLRFNLPHDGNVQDAHFNPSGKLVLTTSADQATGFELASIWNVAGTQPQRMSKLINSNKVLDGAFSPDGKLVATTHVDNSTRIWPIDPGAEAIPQTQIDDTTPDPQATLTEKAPITSLDWSPDSKHLLTSSQDGAIRVWDVAAADLSSVMRTGTAPINMARWSPDGQRIVTAQADGIASIWQTATDRNLAQLQGHTDAVWQAVWQADGRHIATASFDGDVRIWTTEATTVNSVTLRDQAQAAAWLDEQTALLAHGDGALGQWDITKGEITPLANQQAFTAEALNPATQQIALGNQDGTIVILERDGQTSQTITLGGPAITALAFNNNGTQLAAGSDDGAIQLIDLAQSDQRRTFNGFTQAITSLGFDKGGKRLVAASENEARLWDIETGEERPTLRGHEGPVQAAVFSPDDSVIATGSDDETVRLWNAQTGQSQAVLRGHTGPIHSLAFVPNSTILLSASDDQTIQLWDSRSQAWLDIIYTFDRGLAQALWTPKGDQILSLSGNTARLYRCDVCLSADELLAIAMQRTSRELTDDEQAEFGLATTPVAQPEPQLIIQNVPVPQQAFRVSNQRSIRLIMVRVSASSAPDDFNLLRAGREPNSDVAASTHYYIDKEGRITQFVQDKDIAFNADVCTWVTDGELIQNACNDLSLGIMLSNQNDGQDPYPAAQYNASVTLVRKLVVQYSIPPSQLVRSDDVNKLRMPLNAFPWQQFVADVYSSLPEATPRPATEPTAQ